MVTHSGGGVELSTKDRLLDEALRLFAERGYTATSVGDIETAAGLQPRRGGLYKHYPSKQAILEEVVRRHVQAVNGAVLTLDDLPLADLRGEALMMGRWLLDELDRQRCLTRVLEQDGHRIPELRDAAREHISDAGYRSAATLIERWLRERGHDLEPTVVAVALVGSIINFRRSSWTFGSPPMGLDDERFLEGWADLCTTIARP